MRLLSFILGLTLTLGAPAAAQDRFNAAITVNNDAITAYELDQRARMLELFRTPGNVTEVARQQLIEERLKQQELNRQGIAITPENLTGEVDAFASRADLSPDQFFQVLAQGGVARSTLEDFVRIGVSWRDYIRLRYGSRSEVTDADVQRAMGSNGLDADGIEILLSEIIIAAPPPRAAQAAAIADQIVQSPSQAAFEAAARQYSALPSRADGGRLDWLPLSNFPPALRPLLQGLAVGEVTQPISIPNGIALFQSRGIREAARPEPTPTAIDYAMFALPEGQGTQGLAAAQGLMARTDTCDDLYGAAQGLPPEVLVRQTQAPAAIPQDVALELARLDRNEASWNLTRNGGQTRLFLMLCERTLGDGNLDDPDAVRNQLRSNRLEGFAEALLSDLRAAATIRP